MLNLTTRSKQLIHLGMTLALGATLFLSASASATSYTNTPPPPADYDEPQTPDYEQPPAPPVDAYKCDEVRQVYAATEYTYEPHKHLKVACPYDYRAISCEIDIGGKNDRGLSKYAVAINEARPMKFGQHWQSHLDGEYGCHFRANNLLYYVSKAHQPFYWNVTGWATCVPKTCVYEEATHDYYEEHVYPKDW